MTSPLDTPIRAAVKANPADQAKPRTEGGGAESRPPCALTKLAREWRLSVGMYTGFRADVVVRPEYRAAIQTLHDDPLRWEAVASHVGDGLVKPPGVAAWARVGRASFIPFGAVCYMPDDWGEQRSEFDPESGRWQFCCSLKNYEDEIATFTRVLLSRIIERVVYCETLYEEDERPTPAFTPTQLFRVGVARVAALEGVSFETALRMPDHTLHDRIMDEGLDGDDGLAAAVLVRPARRLYDLCEKLADRLGHGPLKWTTSVGPGESHVIVTMGDSLFPTRYFLRAAAGWTGGLGEGRATYEERSAIIDEIRRLASDASDAWRMTAVEPA